MNKKYGAINIEPSVIDTTKRTTSYEIEWYPDMRKAYNSCIEKGLSKYYIIELIDVVNDINVTRK